MTLYELWLDFVRGACDSAPQLTVALALVGFVGLCWRLVSPRRL